MKHIDVPLEAWPSVHRKVTPVLRNAVCCFVFTQQLGFSIVRIVRVGP
jgi:hypothetical protein